MKDKYAILIIDDNRDALKLLTGILSTAGYEVRPADSGELALASAAAQRPDMILLDIRMPDMDGIEVFRRLKALPETAGIPVIMMSAVAEVPERVEGLNLGALDFISKPVAPAELLARIRVRIELHRLHRQVAHYAEAMAASELRYRRLFEAAKDGILILDAETGMIVDVNPFLIELLGFSHESFLGKTVWELGFFKNIVANEDKFAELQRNEYVRYDDLPLETSDGRVIEVEFVSNVYLVEHKKVIQCNIRDISARKRNERALQAKEHEFHSLAESMPQIVWITRADGWNIYFNQQWVDYTGLTLEQSYGHGWNTPFHPDDKQRAWTAWENATQHSGVYSVECRLRRADGAYRWWLVRGVPLRKADGEILKWFGTCTDIEDIKRTEEGLREKEYLLSESQRVGHVGSWMTSMKGRISWSDELYRLYGVSPDTFIPTVETLVGLLHPADQPAMRLWIDACVAGKHPPELEYRVSMPDGTVHYFRGRGQLVCDVENRPTHMAGTVQDITESKLAEAEHDKMSAQLVQAQKMESVGRLAGGVAHDFNNLLMGIMNYAELCRGEIEPDHPIREWLDEIIRDAERSANLTRQLLAFARKQLIAPVVLDINDAISGLLKLLQRLIGEDVVITWRPGSRSCLVKMDPSQIDQILVNLAVNARDAIGGAGSIVIETEAATLDESYCCDHPGSHPGRYTLLMVSDTGSGMDQETQEHIFEPFFTTKGVGQGTGLGLATVYGIVKQNHGSINVYSEPGKGTTFKIYLPRVAAAEAARKADAGPKSPRGNETILLVEDEKSVRITVGMFLEDFGYTVLVAEQPEEGVRIAAKYTGEIHLLISDVIMPGMNGRDMANLILKLRPSIKSLFVSGFTADVIEQRGVLDEGSNFLSKPFGRDQLARKVREVLDASTTSRQSAVKFLPV